MVWVIWEGGRWVKVEGEEMVEGGVGCLEGFEHGDAGLGEDGLEGG